MDDLKSIWDKETGFAGGDISERWWGIISSNYSEDGRIYHNGNYLKQLFAQSRNYEDKLKSSQALNLAIFFHKLKYQPRSVDGEVQSLQEFKKFMREAGESHEDSCLASMVITLLEASATNLTEAHMIQGNYGCEDIHYFLDFIITILGGTPEEYKQYATKIQAEYSHLSSESYRNLRLKTLKNLLLIPNVYCTKEFREERESQARINIQTEIDKLTESN